MRNLSEVMIAVAAAAIMVMTGCAGGQAAPAPLSSADERFGQSASDEHEEGDELDVDTLDGLMNGSKVVAVGRLDDNVEARSANKDGDRLVQEFEWVNFQIDDVVYSNKLAEQELGTPTLKRGSNLLVGLDTLDGLNRSVVDGDRVLLFGVWIRAGDVAGLAPLGGPEGLFVVDSEDQVAAVRGADVSDIPPELLSGTLDSARDQIVAAGARFDRIATGGLRLENILEQDARQFDEQSTISQITPLPLEAGAAFIASVDRSDDDPVAVMQCLRDDGTTELTDLCDPATAVTAQPGQAIEVWLRPMVRIAGKDASCLEDRCRLVFGSLNGSGVNDLPLSIAESELGRTGLTLTDLQSSLVAQRESAGDAGVALSSEIEELSPLGPNRTFLVSVDAVDDVHDFVALPCEGPRGDIASCDLSRTSILEPASLLRSVGIVRTDSSCRDDCRIVVARVSDFSSRAVVALPPE